MLKHVLIKVTNQSFGTGTVRAYPDGKADVLYEVPLYKIVVEGTDSNGKPVTKDFKAYRFGVQLDARRGVKAPRVVGLSDAQTYVLSWSYITTMKQMAWRVYAGFFIHKGPDFPATSNWGSIGCVEISGPGEWYRFNKTIADLSGTSSLQTIGNSKTLKAKYDAALRPPLKLKK